MTKEIEIQKSQIGIGAFNGSRALMPNSIEEAYRIAQAFSRSDFIPKEYKDKPDNCFTAINLGMEIGLPPMRALQSIAVVNGKPAIYGDAQLALVRGSGLLEYFEETYEGQENTDSFTAICKLKRKGDAEATIERFTVADARKAGLWSKTGPWSTHPKRMLRYKARAFALRDKFADVLLGLAHSVEEMQGEMLDVTPKSKTAAAHVPITPPPAIEQSFSIPQAQTQEPEQVDLEELVKESYAKKEVKTIDSKSQEIFDRISGQLKLLTTERAVNNYLSSAKSDMEYLDENASDLKVELVNLASKKLEEVRSGK